MTFAASIGSYLESEPFLESSYLTSLISILNQTLSDNKRREQTFYISIALLIENLFILY